MRCQRCHFENVPGESRCFKCGSVLSGQSVAVDVHPPRMSKWRGPFRAMIRRLRCWKVLPEEVLYRWFPDWLKIMSWNAFAAVILSIVPGLAHLAQRRFKQIRWYFVGWAVFLLAGMFLYGSNMGFLLVGLAIAAHAWIAFHASLIKEHAEAGRRAFDIVMVLVLLAFIYWGIRVAAFRDFVWGYTSLTIPYQSVQSGDCLLARRSRAREETLPRGSLVLAGFRGLGARQAGPNARFNTIGQIVALPGETIEIKGGRFIVNGRVLDSDRFPVPGWLSSRQMSATIPSGYYFVGTAYRVTGVNLTGDMIRSVCILQKEDIEALVVMRWFPLARRGFLRSYE